MNLLFKKKKQSSSTSSGEVKMQELIPVTAKEVQDEFDKAAEEMVVEAKRILEQARLQDEDEILALEEMGFTKAGIVKNGIPLIKKMVKVKEEIKLAEYYRLRYPNYIFLTDGRIRELCEKYGLVMGNPRQYIGEIPKENRVALIHFSIGNEDKRYMLRENYITTFSSRSSFHGFRYKEISYDEFLKFEANENKKDDYNHAYIEKELIVVAPPNLFDLENRVISNYEIVDKADPIVFYPVRGGYLMVTRWGAEEKIGELDG